MNWVADPGKREALNEHGYRIVWARNKFGIWFNAYSPYGAHVDAGYDKEIVMAKCRLHRERLIAQSQMRAAEKAAIEVA